MADDANIPSGWTIDRVILGPKAAVDALDEYERGRRQANERIRDLVETNDRYLNDARTARAELQALRAAMKVRH